MLDSSQFLQLVTAALALFTAALASLALAGYAMWKVREADGVAGLGLAAAGLAKTLAIVVVAPVVAVTSPDLLVRYGGEGSPMAWLLVLPAARLAIGLSIASVVADALTVFAASRLCARRAM